MNNKPSRRSLRTMPKLKKTFEFIGTHQDSPYPEEATCVGPEREAHTVYNNLHLTFSEYQKHTGRQKLPLLLSPEESEGYTTINFRVTTEYPRLLRLNLAIAKLGKLSPHIKLLINRGDVTDMAFSFFPSSMNNHEKIRHVAYISRGRLIVWHDKKRDEVNFPSLRSRNNWYSGYKFEQVCGHNWPSDFKDWRALPKLENSRPVCSKNAVLNLIELPLDDDIKALFLAEYDMVSPNKNKTWARKSSRYIELKCFGPRRCNKVTWQTISNKEALELLINRYVSMRFFKTCLQCKLSGCETVVYGIRSSDTSLVGVRQFQVDELEARLRRVEPVMYRQYYLKALSNVAELVRTLYQQCRENEYYLITKKSAFDPLEIRAVSRNHVLYPEPTTTQLDEILARSESARRASHEYNNLKTNFGFTFIPGRPPKQLEQDDLVTGQDFESLAEKLGVVQI
ncbi:LAFA_0D08086g1_1 [Lachancea sp. 'fantastica']|nr:LAFA_0D08086g1_1 [Lachancea sp. 'fantastica']